MMAVGWYDLLTVLFLNSTGHHSYFTWLRRVNRMVSREIMIKMMIEFLNKSLFVHGKDT